MRNYVKLPHSLERLSQPGSISPQEENLIQGLKTQDQQALRELYDSYGQAIFGVIYRIVNSQETAEELLQEAFVKYWQHAAQYDNTKGRLYTWMLNIARNLAIDRTRSADFKAGQKTETLDNNVYSHSQAASSDPDLELLDMRELVERLRPEQKVLIDLIYFYGYTQAEASAKLKIPLGTVKTRVRAAVMELRKFFVQPT